MLNIYRASAGSGKTYRLTNEYIRLLFTAKDNETAHRRIMAVTFTNKATDEMKTRILMELHTLSIGEKSDYRQELMKDFNLEEAAVNEYAGKILIRILHDYSSFSISTIDKFFQQVIRAFAREIGVNGSYNLELDTDTTLQQAVDNLFLGLSEEDNKLLLQWMTRFAEERVEQSESWNIRKNITDLGKEIFKENYQHKADETNAKLHNRDFLKQYLDKIRQVKNDFEKEVKNTADETLRFLELHGMMPEYFPRQMMHKTLESLRDGNIEIKGTFQKYAEDSSNCYTKTQKQSIKDSIDNLYQNGLKAHLDKIISLVTIDISRYNTADIILKHIDTLGILSDLAVQIKKMTNEQNTMLISDTNLLLNKIIDNSKTPFVYERTGLNIDHFMIDEFQDTSVLQWENFKPLIENSISSGNYNMVVGDVKQSIYRWRNSDWKLLDEQIERDFRPEQLSKQNLDTNWRSDKNIIDFNNSFFYRSALLLQAKFNENIGTSLSASPELEPLTRKIVHAYADIDQKVSTKAADGYLKVEFIPQNENEDGWKQASLQRLPKMLEEIVDRGYKPSDIAFLVRKNDEEAAIIQYLLSYKNSPDAREGFNYNIVGNEGLMLTSSASVQFIIALLKLMANPDDSVQRTILNYEYLRGRKKISESEAMAACFNVAEKGDDIFSGLFTEKENLFIKNSKQTSLYNLVESIFDVFEIPQWHDEVVFLQAFQDVVFGFVNSRNADLNSFLNWWDKNGINKTISTPENQDAFRIMTIHKSKGLDFKVVIIPFCDWALEATRNKPLLWCQPDVEPFNELPLLPIDYSSKLANSIFQKQYFNEQMHQFIDCLNMAYVAFTRAKNEMFCFAPMPAGDQPLELSKMKTLSDLMMTSILADQSTDTKHIQLSENYSEETTIFELGKPGNSVYQEKTAETEHQQLTDYPIAQSKDRLRIKHKSIDFWLSEQNLTDSRLNYGTVMHDILKSIVRRDDEEKAISAMVNTGRINPEESDFIRQELAKFWKMPEVDLWFDNDAEILNESPILLPGGEQYRPDRVIIKDRKALVVDYKFGDEIRKSHSAQVKQYAGIISKMGYEVETYLCYVSLGKVIQ